MSVKSIPNGYEVDCRPQGRHGKRYRKRFKTKSEAMQYERWLMTTKNNKDWVERPKDHRPLSLLIELWFQHKGHLLKDGKTARRKLMNICSSLGDPAAHKLNKRLFVEYRSGRTNSGTKPATVNQEQMLLSGVFTALIDIDEFWNEHPLKGLAKIKLSDNEMAFLSTEEIRQLLNTLSGDMLNIVRLCLATGARWGEAANLKGSQLAIDRVTFINTKTGKNRTVPVDAKLLREIRTGKNGYLFGECYSEFREILLSQGFALPKGQATHVLRHTFASHFMMNGGNILTLQKILGHATIMQTMVYAHLAPDYLNEAIKLNPLTTL